MRFLVDECLSPTLAAFLRDAGHDAVHVAEFDLRGARDAVVMEAARVQRRTVLSADTDFGELLARSNDVEPSVVLYRGREVDPRSLGATLLSNLDEIEEPLAAGAIVVLLDDRMRVRRLPLGVD